MSENNETNNIESNSQYSATSLNNMICVGGHIYDIFIKSGINPKCTPEQWKTLECDIVKYLYSVLGEDKPLEELCNFTALINAFAEALLMTSIMEQKIEELKKSK